MGFPSMLEDLAEKRDMNEPRLYLVMKGIGRVGRPTHSRPAATMMGLTYGPRVIDRSK